MATWHDVQQALSNVGARALAGVRQNGDQLLVALGVNDEGDRESGAERLSAIVRSSCDRHLGEADAAVICAGPAAKTWSQFASGLRAAVDLLNAATYMPRRPWHDAALPELDAMLCSLGRRPELQCFAELHLRPLVDHDQQRRTNLLETLAAYCDHSGHKAETARALHIERQSLYHRLARIEALLGAKLSDARTLLNLHVALRARQTLSYRALDIPASREPRSTSG
jgi:purine catabolism regulator